MSVATWAAGGALRSREAASSHRRPDFAWIGLSEQALREACRTGLRRGMLDPILASAIAISVATECSVGVQA